jgi:orotate phosphoribosyltransferase
MVNYLVEELVKSGALQFGDFTLTSGKMSNYYVDLKAAFTDPGLLMRVAEELGPYTQGYQRMAGTELGAVPVLVALRHGPKVRGGGP